MHTLIAFLIVIGILIFAHELGHFLAARLMRVKVLKFSLGFGPKLIGRTVGETEYLISAFPLGGYVKLLGEEGEEKDSEGNVIPMSPEDRARAFAVQPVWKRAVIVGAGPFFNFVLAYVIFTVILAAGYNLYVPKYESLLPVIDKVAEDSPAMAAGLQSGDKIVTIRGKEVSTWSQMTEIIQGSPDETLEIEVDRGGRIVPLTLTPARKTVETPTGETEIGQIGVSKAMTGSAIEIENPAASVLQGATATYQWTKLTVVGILKLITGKLSLDNIGSPIMIAQVSGDAASQGAISLAIFIAILSINLGIINILPVPPLDGGHLLFFSIESIQARPVSERKRELAQQVGIVLLILLMLRAFYNDVIRIWPGG
jgi:regulator of sigma E protease